MLIRVFLRQDLYVPPGDAAHLPRGVAVLEGALLEVNALGLVVDVTAYLSEKLQSLGGNAAKLLVPVAKIDHVLYR